MSDEPIMNLILPPIFGFGGQSTQAPAPLSAPTRAEAYSRAQSESQRASLLRRAMGQQRRDTILTTSQGDMTPATVHRVSVLGGTS